MNTILKFPGGKWRIADWIISFLPEHKCYCEPYFGSGAIFFNKKPCYTETINDIDGDIVNLFTVCRNYPLELAKEINLTPFSREEFQNCNKRSDNPVEQARRTLVRYHQSFGTSNSSLNSWRNVQQYGGPRCATMWNYLPEAIIKCCERLKQAQIEHTDAIELIKRYNDKETLLYLDPPYLPELRKKNIYKCEMTEADHIKLIETIAQSNSMILISGYDNDLYNETLKDWHTAEIETTAQMGKQRTEKLWMNFEPHQQLKIGEVV